MNCSKVDQHALKYSGQILGPGFGPNILARVGQPWNSSREGRDGHRGLGLFLAVTLVNSLGGQIEIYNEEVGGAAVHITIPRERLTS